MEIKLQEITVKDVTNGYKNSDEEGVVAFGGLLNVRPKYQREFVYKEKQRNAVMDTIFKGYPLNVMYWVKNDDGTYEILDGQQRTISFCEYVEGNYSIANRAFHNLTETEKQLILNYKLMIYVCEGNDHEKLQWFRTINIAGERLTDQELRNATYTGTWLTSAKTYFSKTNCVAYRIAKDYVTGTPIRQEFLETALAWINDGRIEDYMSKHQHDEDATELWEYFRDVIDWVQKTFVVWRKEMKGVNWGELYNKFHTQTYDSNELETRVKELFLDEDVTNKKGIYHFVLSGQQRQLSIRAFDEKQKAEAYERQNGICVKCQKHFTRDQMEADHITPWHEGGKTTSENCQMLCKDCNRRKAGR
ncbi:MAG: DUF262 domain-containing protein [Clostridia bacterium]|nr:DUF262 domain-containing protein [Clostridia bacterium]